MGMETLLVANEDKVRWSIKTALFFLCRQAVSSLMVSDILGRAMPIRPGEMAMSGEWLLPQPLVFGLDA